MYGVSSYFYRSFSIKKRSGGARNIKLPYPKLKYIQQWIKQEILDNLTVDENAFAYVKGKSNIENAKLHIGSNELLKLDIKDFFGNVKVESIESIFRSCGYTDDVSYLLARLCTCFGFLPQGAPTSPTLSNLVLQALDKNLAHFANINSLTFSRYADDIFLSGKLITKEIKQDAVEIVEKSGLPINHNKTKIIRGNTCKIITGLIVTDSTVRVPKKIRREFRKNSFFMLKNKSSQMDGSRAKLNPLLIDEIIGVGNYIIRVEPSNKYVESVLGELQELKKDLFGK
ncbi:RNA-directed DNA polymerase [Pseudoalteromonas sp. JBTF-M23]|uniref:RNA-directed DNA polymerase n=1 Tax=Pseudoalteromonas caenipelagi TaxID=2726988 RepID=A0A849VA69_9GAMM|nr:RNA-directed DNA polymerase [Pseudoalteromonas caenipelagi]